MRVAPITETYPPEVTGVALTLERLVQGLRALSHDVQLVRPRRGKDDVGVRVDGFEEVLARGIVLPLYRSLRLGFPSRKRLLSGWRMVLPDVVHIATKGPLGWSALSAARRLRIPVVSSYHTNSHEYGKHYGLGCLQSVALRYLKAFHNLGQATFVPTERRWPVAKIDSREIPGLHVYGLSEG